MPDPNGGTVGKAMDVLDQVADFGRPVRFSELLDGSRFPKATLFRLVQTLHQQRLLSFNDATQTYAPGIRLVTLAHAAWAQSSLAPIARPFIDVLASTVGEAVHLAQIDSGQVLFIDKRKTTHQFDTLAQTGQVAPAYCTGVGKAILAFMPVQHRSQALEQQSFYQFTPSTHAKVESLTAELVDIRARGVAFDREEHERGIISIAAPILSSGERVVGALSIATSTSRHSLDGLEVFRPQLLEAASKIGAEAASWQFPDITSGGAQARESGP